MRILRKRYRWADQLNSNEDQLRNIVTRLNTIKNDLLTLKNTVDADPDAEPEDIATMAQVETFVNHNKWTDFVNFVNNALKA